MSATTYLIVGALWSAVIAWAGHYRGKTRSWAVLSFATDVALWPINVALFLFRTLGWLLTGK